MRTKRTVLFAAAVVVAFVATSFCFFAWNLQRSLGGVNWAGLAELIEAPLGTVVTRRAAVQAWPRASTLPPRSRKQPSGWAKAEPEEIRRDAALARTYIAALAVGRVALRYVSRGSAVPATSSALAQVESNERVDAWGHPFCFVKVDDRVAVVSGGSSAKTAVACQRLGIAAADFTKLGPGLLYEYSAGTLVLVMTSQRGATTSHVRL